MKLIFFLLLTLIKSDNLKIYIFDVDQCDSQLIVFPSGYSILIDAGENEGDSSATNAKYLTERLYEILGKKEIDVLVLTHVHIDHHGGYENGGIWYLIEKSGFTFNKFIMRNIGQFNGEKFSNCKQSTIDWKYVGAVSSTMSKFVCYATSSVEKTKLSKVLEYVDVCSKTQILPPDENAEIEIIIADALGMKAEDGTILSQNLQNENIPPNENDYSICLRISYGNFVYATCGDLSGDEYEHSSTSYHNIESQVKDMMGEVDLMNVNHHGSKSASNSEWCETLNPTVAVFSCGEDSSAGHPATKPLKNINAVGAKMYLTNDCNSANTDSYDVVIMNGDVVVTVPEDGSKFMVAKKDGSNSASYTIKTNKKARTPCSKKA